MRYTAIPLLALLAVAVCTVRGDRAPASAVQRGCEYLWSQQGQDGGWRSATYGLLKSGQSLTPFVLNALVQIPEAVCKAPTGSVDRALVYIKRNTNPEGAVGKMDPVQHDYPNYASALAVQAIRRAGNPNWRQEIAPIVAWLRTQQLTESHGWKRGDAAYGAWGMGGEPRVAPNAGHVDMSMTRYVLQALAAADVPPTDLAFARGRVFVERCQNPDGGFFFSTVVVDANKAGEDEGARYRSYGTATADGILALLALGDKPSADRVQSATRWLSAHDIPDGAPGFKGEAYRRWTPGLRFYYAAGSVDAFEGVGLKSSRQLISSLESSQRSDGSWRNAENLVKEDDPLIATTFAVNVLNQ